MIRMKSIAIEWNAYETDAIEICITFFFGLPFDYIFIYLTTPNAGWLFYSMQLGLVMFFLRFARVGSSSKLAIKTKQVLQTTVNDDQLSKIQE